MLTFLRKIRRSLVESSSFRKYMIYGLGEIALVVLGILIALQINNWNENRQMRTREVKLLQELKTNLVENQARLKEQAALDQKYFNSAKIIVNHLDAKLPYHDSLAVHFQWSQLSADIVLVTSAYEAIRSIGFDIISNDSLRTAIIDLFDANYTEMVRGTRGLEDLFWPSVTLPLWIKHLRHVSMEDLSYGQEPIDYDEMLADVEFRSMLEKRGIFRRIATSDKLESLAQTKSLIEFIDWELEGGY